MNPLETAIAEALAAFGTTKEANKAYLEFIKANFIIPIENNKDSEPTVLFFSEGDKAFLPVFTNESYLANWADSIKNDIQVLKLSGVDLLKGVGPDVTVCVNIGSNIYKEFNPAEIERMRSMVLKLFKN